MPKPRKEFRQVNIKMDLSVLEKLEAYCNRTGLSKTVAIERLLMIAMDDEKQGDRNKE